MIERRKSRQVKAGGLAIGGGAKISVQSMLNVPAEDVAGNVRQAKALEAAGCEIVRLTVPNTEAVKTLAAVKEAVSIPVVADIHFDYKCALESVAAGVDKIRINPGNIGSDDRVKAVADACRLHNVPIRIGVNSGSLEKELLAKYGSPTPDALCESALHHVALLEKFDFRDIVISIKSSNVQRMVGLKTDCQQIVSCPTCGRTKIDLIALANEVESRLAACKKPITVAVMGCIVNGPGEAKEADIGIAGGDGCGLLFRHGEILKKVPENEIVDALLAEIEKL